MQDNCALIWSLRQQHKMRSKKAGWLQLKIYSETNPLKKLDWNVNEELDLIWTSLALFGGPLTLEAWGKLPLLPPTCRQNWVYTIYQQPSTCMHIRNPSWWITSQSALLGGIHNALYTTRCSLLQLGATVSLIWASSSGKQYVTLYGN